MRFLLSDVGLKEYLNGEVNSPAHQFVELPCVSEGDYVAASTYLRRWIAANHQHYSVADRADLDRKTGLLACQQCA